MRGEPDRRERVRFMRNSCVRILVVMCAAAIAAACGLDRGYVPLDPPVGDGEAPVVSEFGFRHNPQNTNDTRFEGYEVYYKFYTPTSAQFDADRSAIQDFVAPGLESALKGRGFTRIGRLTSSDTVDPLPLVSRDMILVDADVLIDFRFVPDRFDGKAFVSIGDGAEEFRIVRDLESGGGKSFNELDPGTAGIQNSGDPDLSTQSSNNVKEYLRSSGFAGQIDIALVAFATGTSFDDIAANPQVHSPPVVLGRTLLSQVGLVNQ